MLGMEAGTRKLRVLVLDDEAMIAGTMKLLLEDAGHEVVGPAASLDDAMRLADTETIDVAILDANVEHRLSTSVAARLSARRIPYCICSGDELDDVRSDFGEVDHLSKPFGENDLLTIVEHLTSTTRRSAMSA
ncbi:response regulator [Afifella aestuarii]|uniref:response regulator n=1 Tax=Afifella aestuarii TaxID=1909496 RepID=UPI000FE3A080|nr:response regulator [Afifella aestuarii]